MAQTIYYIEMKHYDDSNYDVQLKWTRLAGAYSSFENARKAVDDIMEDCRKYCESGEFWSYTIERDYKTWTKATKQFRFGMWDGENCHRRYVLRIKETKIDANYKLFVDWAG